MLGGSVGNKAGWVSVTRCIDLLVKKLGGCVVRLSGQVEIEGEDE